MTQYNSEIHHRRSIRLRDYDYGQAGAYFITICTYNRVEMFGEINNKNLTLNERGNIVQSTWNTLPDRFPGIELDHFIVMPNHIHGILVRTHHATTPTESSSIRCTLEKKDTMGKLNIYRKSPVRALMLNEIMRAFKAIASYHLHRSGQTPYFRWQREYYEHIIRGTKELDTIRNYIINNPSRWQEDKLHPQSKWQMKQN